MKNNRGLTSKERENLSWNFLVLRGFWRAQYHKANSYNNLYYKLGVREDLGQKYSTGSDPLVQRLNKETLKIVDPEFVKCLVGKERLGEIEIRGKLSQEKIDYCEGIASNHNSKSDRDKFETLMGEVYEQLEKCVKENMPFDEEKTKVIYRVIFWIKFGYEISSEGDRKLINLWNIFQKINGEDYLNCSDLDLMETLKSQFVENLNSLKAVYGFYLLKESVQKNPQKDKTGSNKKEKKQEKSENIFIDERFTHGKENLKALSGAFACLNTQAYLQCKNILLLKRLFETIEKNLNDFETVYNYLLLRQKYEKNTEKICVSSILPLNSNNL